MPLKLPLRVAEPFKVLDGVAVDATGQTLVSLRVLIQLANAAAESAAEPEQTTKDLAMLVRRLVRRLSLCYERAGDLPDTPKIIEQAMDFLKRKNLQGSPLRGE